MLLASSILVACGGKSSASSSSPAASSSSSPAASSSPKEEVKPVYQINASYEELYDMYGAFEFYGLMSSDNTGTLNRALVQNAGDNKNKPVLQDEEISFKYKVTSDEGIDTLEASIGGKKYTGYKNKDGDFVLQKYNFPFAGGYSRDVDLIVTKNITYKTVDEWKAGVEEKYKDRKPTVTVSETYSGDVVYADGEHAGEVYKQDLGGYALPFSAVIELNSDFTVKAVYGAVTPMGTYGGNTVEGTWTINQTSGVHEITLGEDVLTGVQDGAHEKFTWNIAHTVGENTINLKAELAYVEPVA